MEVPGKSRAQLHRILEEITDHLQNGIIPFWLKNGVDAPFGGYLTCFDADGKPGPDDAKYIVTQTRMIWGFSALARMFPGNRDLLPAASQGVDFFLSRFWDQQHHGWRWKVSREGNALDEGKVVYGQSFAIYALAEYSMASGDPRGLEYARLTFDSLQKYAADASRGGYYENMEADWQLSEPGFPAGDRKSLDIHMHLLEAFTNLYECTKEEIHRRRLEEVIDLILRKMLHPVHGCGLNQFDWEFRPIPAITIRRTWNAERAAGEVIRQPLDTTSYGHNLELIWLLNRAAEVLGLQAGAYNRVNRTLMEHALRYGLDPDMGGVYRDGPHDGPALVRDKEWWQNCESLVGFLDGYVSLGDSRCLDAFLRTWEFDRRYFINFAVGEWRQLLTRDGAVLVGDIGNPWKAIYHTGRSMMECVQRLTRLLEQ